MVIRTLIRPPIARWLSRIVVLWLLVAVATSTCYSYGAPTSSCDDMLPVHQGDGDLPIPPQNNSYSLPYILNASVVPNSKRPTIYVTLRGNSTPHDSFEGLLIEARKLGSNDIVGKFENIPTGLKGLSCDNKARSAVTHNSNMVKNAIRVRWIAPKNFDVSNLYFIATIVKSMEVFWVNVTTDVLFPTQTTTPVGKVDPATNGTTTSTSITDPQTPPSVSNATVTTDITEKEATTAETSPMSPSTPTAVTVPLPDNLTTAAANVTSNSTSDMPSTIAPEDSTDIPEFSTSSTVNIVTTEQVTTSGDNVITTSEPTTVTFEPTMISTTSTIQTTQRTTNFASTIYTDISATDFSTTSKPIKKTKPPVNTESMRTFPTDESFTDFTTTMETFQSTSAVTPATATDVDVSVAATEAATTLGTTEIQTTETESGTTIPATEYETTVSTTDITTLATNPEPSTTIQTTLETTLPITEIGTTFLTTDITTSATTPEPFTTIPTTLETTLPTTEIGTTILTTDITTSATTTETLTTIPTTLETTLHTTEIGTTILNTAITTSATSPEIITTIPTTFETTLPTTEMGSTVFTVDVTTLATIADKVTSIPTTLETIIPSSEIASTMVATDATTLPTREVVTRIPPNDVTTLSAITSQITTDIFELSTIPLTTSQRDSPTTFKTESRATQLLTTAVTTKVETTAQVPINESKNEVYFRFEIVNMVFIPEYSQPSTPEYQDLAEEVVKVITPLYANTTDLLYINVTQFLPGSVIPEVVLTFDEDLNETGKAEVVGVVYDEVEETGFLGPYNVSEVLAPDSSGVYQPVDACTVLPCPDDANCTVNMDDGKCWLTCRSNPTYCFNGGTCVAATEDAPVAICRCLDGYEGTRCNEVIIEPVDSKIPRTELIIILCSVCGVLFVLFLALLFVILAWCRRVKNMNSRRAFSDNIEELANSRRTLFIKHATRDTFSMEQTLTESVAGTSYAPTTVDEARIPSQFIRIDVETSSGENLSFFTDSDSDSEHFRPKMIDGGASFPFFSAMNGSIPDLLTSAADYELDVMRSLSGGQSLTSSMRRRSVSFSDIQQVISDDDRIGWENFSFGNRPKPQEGNKNFQVRWDFPLDANGDSGSSDDAEAGRGSGNGGEEGGGGGGGETAA